MTTAVAGAQSAPAEPAAPAAATAEVQEADASTPTGTATFEGEALPIAAQSSLRVAAKLGRALAAEVDKKIIKTENPRVFVTSRTDVTALAAEHVWYLAELALRTTAATKAAKDIVQLKAEVGTKPPAKARIHQIRLRHQVDCRRCTR
jgi:hypothetical protein